MEVSGQLHAPAALRPVPIKHEDVCGLAAGPTVPEKRTPDRPARSSVDIPTD